MSLELSVVVLAAGMGTRMKSALPKVMHKVAGKTMVNHVIDTAAKLDADKTMIVVGPDMPKLVATVAPHPTFEQTDRLGTAHAVLAAKDALAGLSGNVLVLYADSPLFTVETLERLVSAREAGDHAVAVLGFRPDDPAGYGRLVTDVTSGELLAIVEDKECDATQRAINFCNSGVMCFRAEDMLATLEAIDNANAKGEFYLTDAVAVARAKGHSCVAIEVDEEETLGVNSRAQLAVAEAIMQDRLRKAAMEGGATLIDPASVFLCADTKIGRDVIVEPNVVFGPGVTVGDNVVIKAFSHLESCNVGEAADIGPYARLRPGAEIGAGAKVGNFVEIKKAVVEDGAKVNHLSYIGDARVGAKANIGAGTITCNYDGYRKQHTDIGAGAFIGSNSALVAPVEIGDGAIVGAGSTITGKVEADALTLTRAERIEKAGWAAKFREKMRALTGKN
ncbi:MULTISPECIES: bifunctional UDP-N-acetylglucosamine diphosphorylase/glucosamine-1-phosphate N-acetyltransferase GlmU [Thalassospira]|uniref:Bifunctional protein GlmU n=2 Tax=Thalassospira TaxID=168934 RepID=A0A367W467_9PROT|nr:MULTISPECIES: bifunctional UDP-N-acetylglucosamine diphosphorylase/glucosamine-1-phosphate N-acetyltransferase GlmU [Thalassospira]MDG4721197.1 bifunctional UDP-N-acetylglucosamine diphosphorylase/glucosamine-1-phosphate N-acetyltransferase GlmU [Thalassospira sp. FZY0004]RCK33703.1 bifunctional N-acetylglucosamine-1-phosphate uridyltransferase/glucosamine-1-phosphate acetyltransferase [Thalassospira profundimaris]